MLRKRKSYLGSAVVHGEQCCGSKIIVVFFSRSDFGNIFGSQSGSPVKNKNIIRLYHICPQGSKNSPPKLELQVV
jgi:hypothetical protein